MGNVKMSDNEGNAQMNKKNWQENYDMNAKPHRIY